MAVALAFGSAHAHAQAQEQTQAQAQAKTPTQTGTGDTAPEKANAANGFAAFVLDILAPDATRAYIERHLDLLRYREQTDLDAGELLRLLSVAERDVHALLGTLGYFSATVQFEVADTPQSTLAARRVTLRVQPGEQTRIKEINIEFAGAAREAAIDAPLREKIRESWALPEQQAFTQKAWSDAKSQAVRELSAIRYPLAQALQSRAQINPDTRLASLSVTLDSGPAFRMGELSVTGLQRYDLATVKRLARLPVGSDYDQGALQKAQQRLLASGYFDSVFVSLDTSGDPAGAPVLIQVREATLQKLVLGLGYSTDSGPRVSAEHTHHRSPLWGWTEQSKFSWDRDTQTLGTELTAPPDDANWRWLASALLQRETLGSNKVSSQRLRAGRTESDDRFDRNFYLQYDRASSSDPASQGASALSANYAFTQRQFDTLPFPSGGYGLNAQLSVGSTLGSDRAGFLRAQARWLRVWSFASSGRLAIRLEGGAVLARDSANLPATQLFVTGGDNSVRGYAFNTIGAPQANGQTAPGRYLAVGSTEWQRPLVTVALPSGWEHTVFVDAGAVSDTPSALRAKVGVGTGVRWRSPVGPLQMDLAYGVAERRLRLHLNVGFTF